MHCHIRTQTTAVLLFMNLLVSLSLDVIRMSPIWSLRKKSVPDQEVSYIHPSQPNQWNLFSNYPGRSKPTSQVITIKIPWTSLNIVQPNVDFGRAQKFFQQTAPAPSVSARPSPNLGPCRPSQLTWSKYVMSLKYSESMATKWKYEFVDA